MKGASPPSDPLRALESLLLRWPSGVDVVPASALDRHTFATIRPVAIALDAVPDWSLLRSRYPADQPVALLDGERERDSTLGDAERELGRARFLVLPPLEPFADLASLATVTRIAERLRAPNGCPWDREQTHASLRPHLLEEAYEALAALDAGDVSRQRDELGDLLLQIALHAQLGREEGTYDIGAIAGKLNEKLIRRHPHVFAGQEIPHGDLLAQWERIKRDERLEGATRAGGPEAPQAPRSILDGVPRELPALFAAERMQERAARVRLVPPRLDLPLDIDDEDFLGDLLFDVVAVAREAGFDAETALRAANERFAAHVERVETRAREAGRPLESYPPDEMKRLWDQTA